MKIGHFFGYEIHLPTSGGKAGGESGKRGGVMCKCIEIVDEELSKYNTKLGFTIVLDKASQMKAYPKLSTELIEKRRGAKPYAILPSYCPFCGEQYDKPNPPAPPA